MQRMNQWPVRVLVGTCVALILSLITGGTASAHAHLKSSSPADGAKLTSIPATVSALYGEETSLTASKFDVYYSSASGGSQTLIAGGKVDVNDRTKISAPLPAGSGDGSYTVKWHTLTVDDNGAADGSFSFTVGSTGSATNMGGGSTAPATTMGGGSTAPATNMGGGSTAPATIMGGGSILPGTGNSIDTLSWLAPAGLLLLGGMVLRRRRA